MDTYIKVCDYDWGEYPRTEFDVNNDHSFEWVHVCLDEDTLFDITDPSKEGVADQLQGYVDLFQRTLEEYCKSHGLSRPTS